MAEKLLRVPEAADRLGISRKSVYRLVYAGKLRSVPTGSGSRPAIRVVESSVDAFIGAAA